MCGIEVGILFGQYPSVWSKGWDGVWTVLKCVGMVLGCAGTVFRRYW